ncbi:hypothetical protein GJV44_00260 [Candidatus Vallotia cooleyia]|nr:hypothetical protein GJV44_00260 [Candidatus Vallotia cooleyia]
MLLIDKIHTLMYARSAMQKFYKLLKIKAVIISKQMSLKIEKQSTVYLLVENKFFQQTGLDREILRLSTPSISSIYLLIRQKC